MAIDAEILEVAPKLYAIGYELTTWVQLSNPDSTQIAYQTPILLDGVTVELHISRDHFDNISYQIREEVKAGFAMSQIHHQTKPIFLTSLTLIAPKTNDKIPVVVDSDVPQAAFPAKQVWEYLMAMKALATKYYREVKSP